MMAAKSFKSLFQGAGRNALDLPVAGLAALAAAFAAFAVPQDLLSRAVVATGLPSILSAAQPPLGLTARVVLAVGGAAFVFGLVFLLLRLLDRSGMGAAQAEEENVAPRVRRRDLHPDAPTPRPISAIRDLGEPAPPRAPRAPAPVWQEPEPEPPLALEPEPVFEPRPEPVRAPEPVIPIFAELQPRLEAEPEVAVQQEQEQEQEPERESLPEPEPHSDPEPKPDPVPAPQSEMPSSIAELMERLEQGLARRRVAVPAPPASPVPAASPQVFPEAQDAADDRLQSAIASLQRLAARSS